MAVDLFEQSQQRRRQEDPGEAARIDRIAEARRDLLEPLERDGFVLLTKRFQTAAARLLARVETFCAEGRPLMPPVDLAAHPGGVDYRLAPRLSAEDLGRGIEFLRRRTSAVNVLEPLLCCPEIAAIAFDDEILDLAGAYLGCPALLGFIKLTRSFANDFMPFDTEEFHVDGNATRILKAFIHLHETDAEHGAHVYVRGSHREPLEGWDVSARATEKMIVERYGRERIVVQSADVGDVLLEDTSGFHRRGKARSGDRTLLILNYVAHEEYGGGGLRSRITRASFAACSARAKRAARLLEITDDCPTFDSDRVAVASPEVRF